MTQRTDPLGQRQSSMRDVSLFCFGFGYTARALADRITPKGATITGTTTATEKAEAMAKTGVMARIWTGDDFDKRWLEYTNALLISVPPGEPGCPVYLAAHKAILDRRDQWQWIGYLSTNGVYGDHAGAWVNETSALHATSDRAKRRILAENQWLDLAANSELPVSIFRLPGIYGPGRSPLDTVKSGKARRIFKAGQVFNRMHVGDIAAVLEAAIVQPGQHNIYNLADDHPSPPQDVIEYASKLLNQPPPPLIPIEDADMSPMAKSFYADNKRVSNKRMKEALGVSLQYPTYREGLKAIADTISRDDLGTKR